MARGRNEPIICINHITLKDGTTKLVEELTEEELLRVNKSMSERLSQVMSDYYSRHPEEYEYL